MLKASRRYLEKIFGNSPSSRTKPKVFPHSCPDHACPDHSGPDYSGPDYSGPDHACPDHACPDRADACTLPSRLKFSVLGANCSPSPRGEAQFASVVYSEIVLTARMCSSAHCTSLPPTAISQMPTGRALISCHECRFGIDAQALRARAASDKGFEFSLAGARVTTSDLCRIAGRVTMGRD